VSTNASQITQTARTIALVMGAASHYVRGVLAGVRRFAHEEPHWRFQVVRQNRLSTPLMMGWKPDGIIAHVSNWSIAEQLLRLQIPVVNVSESLDSYNVPRVGSDSVMIGQLAASHLASRGFRHFAYVGTKGMGFSVRRESAFLDAMAAIGYSPQRFLYSEYPLQDLYFRNSPEDASLRRWLFELPKPVGVFACNDDHALKVMDICRQSGLRVPEDIALLGVDNDEVVCDLVTPRLSSISRPMTEIGFAAARTMAAILHGEQVPQETILQVGIEVAVRDSTEVYISDDAADSGRSDRNAA
jgi:LacI family transcriptional regulator